ncbi:hypothetical protein [Paenibacillus spongiae]|uniref:Uncharacterized protein n=1 Tax=Paenibacillus spongiae TaxID=2909671 RepID=A0ABY5S082_9BACL|nr:hypothetical protein [Paenibacillus spongiae]UVI27264.1 hypothetical protein L1F29_17430 [Paenibacillus spongiae]
MSKLVRLLKQQPALIISLPGNSMELFRAAVEGGADAIKIHFNVEHRASGTRFGSIAEYGELLSDMCRSFSGPIGAVVGDSVQNVTREEVNRLTEAGADFISLYAHHAPGWLLNCDRISKMIAVSGDYEAGAVSAFRSLPIEMLEASIVPAHEYGSLMSVKDLLQYRWLAEQSGKPVIVPSQRSIRVDELEALRLSGMSGIMIGAMVTGTDAQSIYEATGTFRRGLDELGR